MKTAVPQMRRYIFGNIDVGHWIEHYITHSYVECHIWNVRRASALIGLNGRSVQRTNVQCSRVEGSIACVFQPRATCETSTILTSSQRERIELDVVVGRTVNARRINKCGRLSKVR